MVDFGNKLKSLRLRDNMTQAVFGERLGVTKSVVSAYGVGTRMPSYDVLVSIARTFKVSTDYLLGLERSNDIDVSGLTFEEVEAIKALIKAMQNR